MRIGDEEDLYPLGQVRETLEGLPHFRELGLAVSEFERGRCTLRIDPSPLLIGNPDTGALHGGVITTLLDSAGGAAAFSVVRRKQTVATLDLRIDYLRTAAPDRAIYGRAECYRLTRSVAFVRGVAFCDAKKPVANFAAAFAVGSVGFSIQ
jgi:uncharacterized protein (TIGR00369 family)